MHAGFAARDACSIFASPGPFRCRCFVPTAAVSPCIAIPSTLLYLLTLHPNWHRCRRSVPFKGCSIQAGNVSDGKEQRSQPTDVFRWTWPIGFLMLSFASPPQAFRVSELHQVDWWCVLGCDRVIGLLSSALFARPRNWPLSPCDSWAYGQSPY